ncbi:MAG: hypothetical protein O2960_19575 [Verrucomicrobia bacterium]|nr:hypothetical protein [Verrucomicrobiota bacterium]
MILADVITWFLLIVGIILVLNSYWLASVALWPRCVAACAAKYCHPWRITLTGLGLSIPCVIIVALLRRTNHPAIIAISVVLLGTLVILGLVGSSGLARKIGQGLVSPTEEAQPWRQVLRGGLVFAVMMLLPFVGWFVVLPWALFSGLGAMTLVWFEFRRSAKHNSATASPDIAHDPDAPMAEPGGVSSAQPK